MSNKGRAGETAALLCLQEQGYMLLAQNFRFKQPRSYGKAEPLSEIDLILLAPDEGVDRLENFSLTSEKILPADTPLLLVFVEVKNWSYVPLGDVSLNLTEQRQHRMFRTAECFLQCYPRYALLKRRFDLFALQGSSEPLHIKAAFAL